MNSLCQPQRLLGLSRLASGARTLDCRRSIFDRRLAHVSVPSIVTLNPTDSFKHRQTLVLTRCPVLSKFRVTPSKPSHRSFSTDNPVSVSGYDFSSDPDVKSWMSQMTEDFHPDKKELNTHDETSSTDSGVESDIESSSSDSDSEFSSDSEKAEFTEMEYEEFFNEEQNIQHEQLIEQYPLPIELTRGKQGVFDVEELVTVLEEENGQDIIVIPVPPEIQYADNLLIVTGKSFRHLVSMAELIRWIYKRKRGKTDPQTIKIEGLLSRDWLAMDIGNVVVHLMLGGVRQKYDLETLWLHGPENDPQCQQQDNPYIIHLDDPQYTSDHSYPTGGQTPRQSSQGMESLTGWHQTPDNKPDKQ